MCEPGDLAWRRDFADCDCAADYGEATKVDPCWIFSEYFFARIPKDRNLAGISIDFLKPLLDVVKGLLGLSRRTPQ